jgi:hypothetical protein
MLRRTFFVFALIASLAFVTGPASAQEPCNTDLRARLLDAANQAGVAVNPDDILTSVNEGGTVATTTIAGYEGVPGSALPGGVNAGFIYFDAPGSGIPAGFYTLRASAQQEDLRVGGFPGRVELVSAGGEVAANLPASIDAFSLEVPNPLPFPRTTITQDLQRTGGSATLTKAFRWRITITIRCPNGTTIRFSIGW